MVDVSRVSGKLPLLAAKTHRAVVDGVSGVQGQARTGYRRTTTQWQKGAGLNWKSDGDDVMRLGNGCETQGLNLTLSLTTVHCTGHSSRGQFVPKNALEKQLHTIDKVGLTSLAVQLSQSR
jgi:hypothetical protein